MVDPNSKKILKSGTLPKAGGAPYSLVVLTSEDIGDILALQDTVYNALPQEQKAFMLKKEADFFHAHFAQNNIVLGVVHNGELVAQSIVLNPSLENPKTGMVDMDLREAPEKTTVLQGVIVHPEYRGNFLMSYMVDAWLDVSKENDRRTALAEVSVDNPYSWGVFLKEGVKILSIGVDPSDGTVVYNMAANVSKLIERRAHPEFNDAAQKEEVSCPANDILAQKGLLCQGFKGVSFNPKENTICFIKKSPPALSAVA